MTDTLDVIVRTREDAHTACVHGYALAQALLMDGKRVHVLVSEDAEPVTVKQHRFLHGVTLPQISEQVRLPDGSRYTVPTWKLYFKDRLLEVKPRYEMVKLPGQKRATPRRKRWSLTELSVKRMAEFIDAVIAIAADDFNVRFHFITEERDAVRYVRPSSRKSTQQNETEHV